MKSECVPQFGLTISSSASVLPTGRGDLAPGRLKTEGPALKERQRVTEHAIEFSSKLKTVTGSLDSETVLRNTACFITVNALPSFPGSHVALARIRSRAAGRNTASIR